MKRNLFIGLIIGIGLLLSVGVYAQGYVFGPNVRVSDYPPATAYAYTPNAGQRGVAVRGDTVYCAWDDSRTGGWGVWFSKSIDGGQTFLPNVQVDDGLDEAYTPTIAVGTDGTIYIAWDGIPPPFTYKQVFFSRSTDGGLTFTPDLIVNDTTGGLKNRPHREPSMAVDTAGTIYIAFDDGRNGPGNYDIYFSKSTDGGNTFLSDVLVNDTIADTLNDTRPALALSDNGDIYVSWSKNNDWLYVTKSTDGGLTFGPDVQVNDTVDQSWMQSIDIDCRGYIHLAWFDLRDGNANIYYSRSTDGGLTFSPNIIVNDSAYEPAAQASPSMCVDDSGMVYAVWEDNRNFLDDQIEFTVSTDAEDTSFVEPNVRVSDSDSLSGYPSIAVGDSGKVYVLWVDFRNGFAPDVFFSVGKYESGVREEGKKDTRHKTTDIRLTIHPNPFSNKTVIEFRSSAVESFTPITLKIYDISGRLIHSFPSSLLSLRSSVTWDGRDERGKRVVPGIYFIRGEIGKQKINKKVALIR